jgi:hypothetical protein
MPRRFVLSILCVLALASVSASARQTSAPNLAGTWTGFLASDVNPSDRDSVLLTLKQAGAELTGSGGPNADQQWPIQKGKVSTTKEGTTATFLVVNDTLSIQFDLKLVEGRLKGTIKAQRNGQERTGTVDLERAK